MKIKIANYLFVPPFQSQPDQPIIISESGIGIEIIYYPVKFFSEALNIQIQMIGGGYRIPQLRTDYYTPNIVIGQITFNYKTTPIMYWPTSGGVIDYGNSIPLIPATQQLIYQDFDKLLVYFTASADNWAFLLRIIKERP